MAVNTGLGHVLYLRRDYDAAILQYRKALEIDPAFGPAHLWFGRPYLQKEMYDEAIAEIQKAVTASGGSTISLAVLADAYASAGKKSVGGFPPWSLRAKNPLCPVLLDCADLHRSSPSARGDRLVKRTYQKIQLAGVDWCQAKI